MWGETTRVENRGETTRGETTREETSWGRNVLLPFVWACVNTRLGVQKCIFHASRARARDFLTTGTNPKSVMTAR